jgi:alkyl hydroperoxide reductase subunit AhpC
MRGEARTITVRVEVTKAIEPVTSAHRAQRGLVMALRLGDTAPDFQADTTEGRLRFHEWLGDSWGVLFSHPKDFTPVCTTELGYMARLKPEFDKRNTKIIGLSVDPVESHMRWSRDIADTQGYAPNYPMIGDGDLQISKLYNMLPADTEGTSEGRTAMTNQTVRTVFVVGPDKKIKLMIVYPMSTGRNFDEILRAIDSLQLTATHKVSTPVNWKQGEPVIISGSVSDDEARRIYPDGWESPRPYIRIVPQPAAKPVVRYRKDSIATFDVPPTTVFKYMSAGNHPHAAFKSHRLVGVAGNIVTVEAEVYNPDGSTFTTTITHTLNQPKGVETTMKGGPFDGARFTHSYTAVGDKTKVDLAGDFPAFPGMPEADELAMIDGFFTGVFNEDTATLRKWA